MTAKGDCDKCCITCTVSFFVGRLQNIVLKRLPIMLYWTEAFSTLGFV